MKKTYKVDAGSSGMTVRDYIRSKLGFSARRLKLAKYNGKIEINGNSVFTNHILKSGDILVLEFPDEVSETIIPENIPLDIIYEDDDFIAINKPYNMPVHPSVGHRSGTLANAVMFYFKDRPFVFRALTRLDIDTTGVVLIAKNAEAAAGFNHAEPKKEYLAITIGIPSPSEGIITAPIGRAEGIIKRCVRSDGKPSETKYKLLATDSIHSLVEAIPLTGRTHQIRVHLSHIGAPLHGDYLYGTEIEGERTKLHCQKVTFIHPITLNPVSVYAPMPDDFKKFTFKDN